jgi:tRNA-splicing ligase RtcB
MSCSHGAGRKMGRNQAIRTLDLQKEIDSMNRQGIIHELRTVQNLDEAPGAYKDIDTVMNNQRDLVKILVELRPLAVVKG